MDPFDILVESGGVGSSFWKNMKASAKTSSLASNSPYLQIANYMSDELKQMVQNSLHPSEVAKDYSSSYVIILI